MRACGNFWDVPDCTFARFCTLLHIFCGIFNTFQGDYFFYSHIFDNILPSKTNMKKFLHAKVRVRVWLNFGKFAHVHVMCVRPKIEVFGCALQLTVSNIV